MQQSRFGTALQSSLIVVDLRTGFLAFCAMFSQAELAALRATSSQSASSAEALAVAQREVEGLRAEVASLRTSQASDQQAAEADRARLQAVR